MEYPKRTWKIFASLIFCMLFFTTCKNVYANEANAGLCNGAWGIAGGYYCNMNGGVGGGTVLCVFFGRDNDRNGVYRSGTSDQCIIDRAGNQSAFDCNEMCRLNNSCSKISCPVGAQLENLNGPLGKLDEVDK
ncbi:hypothetical protein ACW9HW_18080 [Pseudomonas sp. SDO5532_S415]|jgi:hypothetical protein